MPKRMTRETFNRIVDLLAGNDLFDRQIGHAAGVHTTTVFNIRKGLHFYQQTPESQERRRYVGRAYIPTAEEIETECLRLRADRLEDDSTGWTPPVYSRLQLEGLKR